MSERQDFGCAGRTQIESIFLGCPRQLSRELNAAVSSLFASREDRVLADAEKKIRHCLALRKKMLEELETVIGEELVERPHCAAESSGRLHVCYRSEL